jgi:Domain of unknown function (DUF4145)
MISHCTQCDDPQNFEAIAAYNSQSEFPPCEYTLAKCDRCLAVSLFIREDIGEGLENDGYYRVWPPQSRHLGFELPEIVKQSYEQAVLCEKAKAYVAAVVMVRRAMEAVTVEHEAGVRSLQAGLKGMFSRGLISQEILDWGHELRVIGNMGAHPTKETLSRADAVESIDFLQAILEILYDLRPKFERMRARRAAGTATPQPQ